MHTKSPTVYVYGAAAPYDQSSRPSTQNIAMYYLTDAFTLLVTLRLRLVTWGRCQSGWNRVSGVCLSTLPSFGSVPSSSDAPHNKIQRLFTGGQSLQDVAASLRQGAVQPSELPMFGIEKHEMKWCSRNNRRLWCFKEANVEAVEVFTSSGLLSRLGCTIRLHFGWFPGRAVLA